MNTIHTIDPTNPFAELLCSCMSKNIRLEFGRLNVLIGENGSGKTALLKALEYTTPEFSAAKYKTNADNIDGWSVQEFFSRNSELFERVAHFYEEVMGHELKRLTTYTLGGRPVIRWSGGERQVIEVLSLVLSNYKINNVLHTSLGIDDYANRLNPKLAARLTHRLYTCALENDKQLVLTTHNAGVLDGLDLNDDDQRLFVVERTVDGGTTVSRVERQSESANKPIKAPPLSEAWMRGYLGGLPNHF